MTLDPSIKLTRTGLIASGFAHGLIAKVKRPHILRAAKHLDLGQHGSFRNGRENAVEVVGSLYPPKAICSAAVKYATGIDLLPTHFNGGFDGPWLNMLRNLNFPVDKTSILRKRLASRKSSKPRTLSINEAEEGFREDRTSIFRKRNRDLVLACKARDKHKCRACGFKVVVLGNAVIDCHHLDPLASTKDGRVTNIDRLVCLCPTCHRIAHSRNPPLGVSEIRRARKGKLGEA